ncbi:LysM peptidoglycan-binding domain-containing protein [Bacillus ginsengihumi]|uniref:LysM peptidoglycan-binding domain-containing protein n=1 Tax=Heyndrickxia ginsengihumi TaxID=363870 RepID=A0A0A6V9N9_9BACI|nr:LysM peptidoglycan-binding domain-containing protein [Heyndrickxia ginsengihumi]KHD84268.1 hypothetical protein NG54_16615 [Heyndrickxia ginsengihumi]MBE6183616.1 LysM peptidoglycan-binding domain-containing protein [Bacillus sp. (in: firmicutes)]MCM3023058.1 LysM peptidoglycan-binding domain-containing protein [Heyndrickxia ginsengihumi]NEY19528.1 LysM peptidoglycan-binding domain-containing protein [Heyndrickxia ginsengihumi]
MNNDQKHELRKIISGSNEYEIIFYYDKPLTEFSDELGSTIKENKHFMATTKKFIGERYPNFKITMAKVVIGGIAVTSFKLLHTDHVQAATMEGNQVSNSSSIYYQVSSGDTLSKIATKYHTSSTNIKQANHLKSDVIKVNQLLIIP